MSTISRRKFLKGAGAAALAVAAVGVLAGCSTDDVPDVPGTDVPDIPQVTSKTVTVYFTDATTGAQVGGYKMTVLKSATVVDPAKIPTSEFPADYIPSAWAPVEIKTKGDVEYAEVPVMKATQEITVSYIWSGSFRDYEVATRTISVPSGLTSVPDIYIEKEIEGKWLGFKGNYKVSEKDGSSFPIENGKITVEVERV